MSIVPAASNRVLMVVSRAIPELATNGRERTMAFIKRALSAGGTVEIFRLYSLLEKRSLARLWASLRGALSGWIRGRPMPLQTLLFFSPHYLDGLEKAIARFQPKTVYFDGVRSGVYALMLRHSHPQLNLVCDFDDLMSRRIEILIQQRQPISPGYLKQLVPVWVQRHLLNGLLMRHIRAYERSALRSLEKSIAQACNKVVLVSSVEAAHFYHQCSTALIEVIPPIIEVQRPWQKLSGIQRFVFIGADSMLQNRLTIEYLVAIWQRLQPQTELHIFGKQVGNYPDVPGVVFRGFVDDVADAYVMGSVLLAPSFVTGGVKTKVLEAIAHGVVPVGNATTFEGIDTDCRKLILNEEEIKNLVCAPGCWTDLLNVAGAAVAAAVVKKHGASLLGSRWREIT